MRITSKYCCIPTCSLENAAWGKPYKSDVGGLLLLLLQTNKVAKRNSLLFVKVHKIHLPFVYPTIVLQNSCFSTFHIVVAIIYAFQYAMQSCKTSFSQFIKYNNKHPSFFFYPTIVLFRPRSLTSSSFLMISSFLFAFFL